MRLIDSWVNHHYMVCRCQFLLNSSDLARDNPVTETLENKLDRLEMLFAEQDYTIQTLNDMVAQQDQEISQLNVSLELLKDQLQALRFELSGDIDPGNEKPPHY